MEEGEFIEAARDLGVLLDGEQAGQFRLYEARLREWSARVRLVSRGDREHLRERHFLDCLAVVPHLPAGGAKLLDLGSGAGLPGIPIKIARREIQVTLLEPARMKALFLRQMVEELDMDGITAVHGRAEAVAEKPGHEHAYDVVVARGVAALPGLWRLSRPFLSRNGALVAFKGPGEVSDCKGKMPPGVALRAVTKRLPKSGKSRVLVFVSEKVE